jgi:hypothetical protein
MAFPNRETQIGAAHGPKPGKRVGARLVSERRARKLARATKLAQAANAELPKFDGDSVAFLKSVYEDPTVPLELRVVAARCATSFERASIQPKPEEPQRPKLDLTTLSDAERNQLMALLARVTGQAPRAIQIEATPEPPRLLLRSPLSPDATDAEVDARIAELEAELERRGRAAK